MSNNINSIDCLSEIKDKPKGKEKWVEPADFEVRYDFTQKEYQNINWLHSQYTKLKLNTLQTWQNGVEPEKVKYFINNPNEIKNIAVVNYYGDNIIVDGNHRATAAIIIGKEKIRAEYINYENAKINEI